MTIEWERRDGAGLGGAAGVRGRAGGREGGSAAVDGLQKSAGCDRRRRAVEGRRWRHDVRRGQWRRSAAAAASHVVAVRPSCSNHSIPHHITSSSSSSSLLSTLRARDTVRPLMFASQSRACPLFGDFHQVNKNLKGANNVYSQWYIAKINCAKIISVSNSHNYYARWQHTVKSYNKHKSQKKKPEILCIQPYKSTFQWSVQRTGVSDCSPVWFTTVLRRLMSVRRHRCAVLAVTSVSCTYNSIHRKTNVRVCTAVSKKRANFGNL